MLISKSIKPLDLLKWSGQHFIWLTAFVGTTAALYYFKIFSFAIPWLPTSVVGTAVAFYVGFKNSQAYERMWEARKIWGGIVNSSRTWGMMVDGFITNQFVTKTKLTPEQITEIKKRLVYRHIAWLYVHRSQLLVPTPWEHISQGGPSSRPSRPRAGRHRS